MKAKRNNWPSSSTFILVTNYLYQQINEMVLLMYWLPPKNPASSFVLVHGYLFWHHIFCQDRRGTNTYGKSLKSLFGNIYLGLCVFWHQLGSEREGWRLLHFYVLQQLKMSWEMCCCSCIGKVETAYFAHVEKPKPSSLSLQAKEARWKWVGQRELVNRGEVKRPGLNL